MGDRKQRDDIFKGLKEGKNCEPRGQRPENVPFKSEDEIEAFPDKGRLREFVTSKLSYRNTKGSPFS